MYTHLTAEQISARLETSGHPSFHEEVFPQFAGRPPREAAVLVPLARVDGEWQVLYTRRTDLVKDHKGQVSFPGGATDPQDTSPEATALREAQEEVGLRPEHLQVLGQLGEMRTVTNFIVTPVVAVFPWPYAFKVHTVEVSRVFTLPLEWLADHDNWQEFFRKGTSRSLITYFPYDGELLWGVTARITVEFIRAIGLISAED
ncbi:MAG TPA: CoA pyrophosphatase [Anaerolineales bacterium]|jgi:8-oxo-dGTP pyrophosphatase MutT (NUDIX family)